MYKILRTRKNWIQSYYLLDYQDYKFIILGHCLDLKTQSKTCGINLKITSSHRAINGWQDSIYSESLHLSADSFVSRVRLQTKKCGTRDTREFNDRVIETIISGVKYDIVQRDLLAKPETLSLDEPIGMCRNYEVAADQLKELKDVQQSNATQSSAVVNAIGTHNQPTPYRKCDYCGRLHPRRATCQALGTTCSNCGRRNHWAVVFRSRSKVPQHHQQYQQQHQQPRLKRNQTSSLSQKNVHTLLEDSYFDEDKPGQIQMNNVHINTVARDEAIFNISVQLPDRPLVPASMEVKVDTGAQGNVLPMRAFRVMCTDRIDSKRK